MNARTQIAGQGDSVVIINVASAVAHLRSALKRAGVDQDTPMAISIGQENFDRLMDHRESLRHVILDRHGVVRINGVEFKP